MQIKLTPITPTPLNAEAMRQEFIRAMRDVGETIRENFEDTTQTWNHKPKWDPVFVIPKVGVDFITVETTTVDKVYGWVNEGTPEHPIPKVPGVKKLAFPGQFIAKTSPGIIGSG